ncbi:DUF5693 family protein [Paenibacillus sp. PK4536]|uniref:DUF5693 family protein n=1 Tax=Paenibacillus sp. PK4536 TaxID=3024576 RepID=UPI0023597E62|nr:DUF5693 family protein [Paenibacillus sp. PK4536]WIM39844.1 DUF5693 family protein [Paenibacillus sp. PK4536]
MVQKWQHWNNSSVKWLWILVIIGLVASLPIAFDRTKTESTSKNVEFVFNYRNLIDIASYQPHPQDYIKQQLQLLKDAGIGSVAVYQSNLSELQKSQRLNVYNSVDVANLQNQVIPQNENFTYVQFTSEENAQLLEPVLQRVYNSLGIPVVPWSFKGLPGVVIQTSADEAGLKPLDPDPITMRMLHNMGFQIVPRLNDSLPYDQNRMNGLLSQFAEYGVKTILFDGESVTGFTDDIEKKSIANFATLLNQHGIGIAAIENLKKPQTGFSKLAYLMDYNVVRLYSLSESDSKLDPYTVADRFALAAKDRNIRMMYINLAVSRDTTKAQMTNSIDNVIKSLQTEGHAIQNIESHGFKIGPASAMDVSHSVFNKYFKLIVLIGAIAYIALLVSYFVRRFTLIVFVLGLVGSAGMILIHQALILEQGIALLAAISAPTIAMIYAVRKVDRLYETRHQLSVSQRVIQAVILFIRTSLWSLTGALFIIGLLNDITYQLVINQFRGVSLLHFAPIALIAVYIAFYRGKQSFGIGGIRKVLTTPITLTWIIVLGIVGIVGMYYLSRTGNAGTVTPLEMHFRNALESLLGVRPRNKEFLMAHPLFILGVFIAAKYRHAIYIMIIACIGQLSMVDTFAHIHSPVHISLIRGLLGMGLGLILGLVAVIAWQILERCWKKWLPLLRKS